MSAPAFLEAFRALQTPAARREALVALADEFSPYEWRQLQALAMAKSFQFDIIGRLPAELVFHILSYLDIVTPFRLQSVSRRWCHVLRSTEVSKPALRAWYDNTVSFEDASYEDCLREAQSIHRLRTGRYLEVSATENEPSSSPNCIALVGDFLIDVPHPSRQLRVTNLRTGQGWRAVAEGHELISRVTASSQLVAFWTTAHHTCYVFDFAGTRKAKFRLPPSMNRIATCGGRTIICGGIVNHYVELYIWNLDSQKGRTLRLDQSPFGSCTSDGNCVHLSVLPNSNSPCFTLFISRACDARYCGHRVLDMSIRYYNITFEGQLVHHRVFSIPIPAGSTNLAGASITSIRPVDRTSGFQVNVCCRYNHNGCNSSFFFDETLQIFRDPGCPNPDTTTHCSEVTTSWWRDSFYHFRAEHDHVNSQVRFVFVHLGTSEKPNLQAQPFFGAAGYGTFKATHTQLLVNENFAVLSGWGMIYVFSFREKAKIADPKESEGRPSDEGLVLRRISSR